MRIFRKSLLIFWVITILLFGSTAIAKEKNFTEKVLPNGARFVYKQLPKAQTVTARIIVPAGFLDEPREYLEIAHLLEHLVFRGKGQSAISDSPELMDEDGNTYNAFTTLNRTEYILESTSENLSVALPFFLDLILHPTLAPADIEKEKKIVTIEKALRTRPGDVFLTYLNHLTQNQLDSRIQAINREQLQAFHREYYTLDQLTVIITGSFNVKEITDYLSALPPPPTKAARQHAPRPTNPLDQDIMLEDYLPGEKYRLLFGFNLKKLKGKELIIAKTLPYILTFESRQYDYVTNRPLDYDCYLFNLGEEFYLIFEYKDVQEDYTLEMSKWHERNIRRYYKYLKAKDFSRFLKALAKNLENQLKLIEASPNLLGEYYARLIFEPTTISKADLTAIKRLSSSDLKKFVEKYLEEQDYHQVVIKAQKPEGNN
ncbi:MAG: insulinase family protein [Firmicutes bacterium]|nr:insulinase family protein [Bacillota bacterium]